MLTLMASTQPQTVACKVYIDIFEALDASIYLVRRLEFSLPDKVIDLWR